MSQSASASLKELLSAIKNREHEQDKRADELDKRLRDIEKVAHSAETRLNTLFWIIGVATPVNVMLLGFVLYKLFDLAGKLPVKP